MANIELLQGRIAKSKEKVEKIKSTIERHKKALEKKKISGEKWEIERKEDDIVQSNKKLAAAEAILEKWEKSLSIELEKQRFIEGKTPETIKDFLETWKENAIEWHLKKYEAYQKFKEELNKKEYELRIQCIKETPEYERYVGFIGDKLFRPINLIPRKPIDDFLKKEGFDWRGIEKRKTMFAGANVIRMDSMRSNKAEREKWIKDLIERDKQTKMFELINRISGEIGKIKDASELVVNQKGNLDGVIHGEKGSVELNTIGAGGFNIQCFHYRTLLKKL